MKTFNSILFFLDTAILKKSVLSFLTLFLGLGLLSSQTYNPNTGNTHYPNGTIYISTSPIPEDLSSQDLTAKMEAGKEWIVQKMKNDALKY